MLRAQAIVAVLLVLLVVLGSAQADKPDARRQAKAHFAQGKAFQDAGAFADAIREYEAAYKLVPLPQLLFNVGQANRLKGDKQAAIEAYQKYLAAVPEGPVSDEARGHVATLRLKIQVEEADAARQRAEEAAVEARRREAEQRQRAEDERRRREEEVAARRRSTLDDEARLKRLAEELRAAEQRKKAEEEKALAERLALAGKKGRALRIVGAITIPVGILVLAGSVGPLLDHDRGRIDEFNQGYGNPWTLDLDKEARALENGRNLALGIAVAGLATVAIGAVLVGVGKHQRTREQERARSVTVSARPWMAPSGGGLALNGGF